MQENRIKTFIEDNLSLIFQNINNKIMKDIGEMSPIFFNRLIEEYLKKKNKKIKINNLTTNTFGYYLITEILGEAKQAYPFFRKDTMTLEKIFNEAKVYFNHVKFDIKDNIFTIYLIQTKAGVSTLEEEIIKFSKHFPIK